MTNAAEVSISSADVEELLRIEGVALPTTLAANLSLYRSYSGHPLTALFHYAAGPSALRMLGRFLECAPELHELAIECAESEERAYSGAIVAEIDHMPAYRSLNIQRRRIPYRYRIAIDPTSASGVGVIRLDDLWVGVVEDRVILYSKAHRRRVVPRLSTAHNFHLPGTLNLYRFLCSLQNQGDASFLAWTWGPFEYLPCLPRVRYQNIILSPRRWHLDAREIETIRKLPQAQQFEALGALRATLDLPRYCRYGVIGNELLYDLENPHFASCFLRDFKAHKSTAVHEELDGTVGGCLPRGDRGERYMNEVIVPLRAVSAATDSRIAVVKEDLPGQTAQTSTIFPPGSPWYYVKVYCSGDFMDSLVCGDVGPRLRKNRIAGRIEKWFFVRYRDDYPHLRLRWYGRDSAAREMVREEISRILQRELVDGNVWRLEIGTYQRELARYGGSRCTDIAEDVFCCDAEYVLELRQELATTKSEEEDLLTCGIEASAMILTRLLDSENDAASFARAQASARATLRRNSAHASRPGWTLRTIEQQLGRELAVGYPGLGRTPADIRMRTAADRLDEALRRYGKALDHVSIAARERAIYGIVHMFLNRLLDRHHFYREVTVWLGVSQLLERRRKHGIYLNGQFSATE